MASLDRKWFILQGQLNQGKLEYKFLTTVDSVLEGWREFASIYKLPASHQEKAVKFVITENSLTKILTIKLEPAITFLLIVMLNLHIVHFIGIINSLYSGHRRKDLD